MSMAHKKRFPDWHQAEDTTSTENVVVGFWVPEKTFDDMEMKLSDRDRQEIQDEVYHTVVNKTNELLLKYDKELLRTGD
jgi:hypothetical protein